MTEDKIAQLRDQIDLLVQRLAEAETAGIRNIDSRHVAPEVIRPMREERLQIIYEKDHTLEERNKMLAEEIERLTVE